MWTTLGTLLRGSLGTLLRGSLRDRISLFWSIVFPVVLMLVLGIFFGDQTYRVRLFAAMLAISVMFFALSGTSFEALAQRTRGVYKLLRATPMRTIAFVTHLTIARTLVSLLSATLVAVAGMLIYRLPVHLEHALLLVLALTLGGLCFTFLGVFVGNLARQEAQVSMFGNLLTMPMIFTSSAFYSLQTAPGWVHALGVALPFSHLLDAVSASLSGDVAALAGACLLLASYTCAALALAVLTFRWDPDATLWSALRSRLRLFSRRRGVPLVSA